MGIAHEVSVVAGHAMSGVHAGDKKLAAHKVADGVEQSITVRSVAFDDGAALPISCTVDGVGAPPPLSFHGVPESARAIVVICEDPDAPFPEPYVHWMVYGMPGVAEDLDAQSQVSYQQGQNSKLELGYTPAAPPPGHGVHHYHFQVFALDRALSLADGIGRSDLLDELRGHVLAWGELIGTYERQ
ncbi:MAG TPA: YbhB/YbcL family Raf kinase inhibitor-like protein [Polyangiaceae bacterium]|nr:YbhB/YbcL family Raf kinase inhibitor-like protein [Polyangiaceae bacterium]